MELGKNHTILSLLAIMFTMQQIQFISLTHILILSQT